MTDCAVNYLHLQNAKRFIFMFASLCHIVLFDFHQPRVQIPESLKMVKELALVLSTTNTCSSSATQAFGWWEVSSLFVKKEYGITTFPNAKVYTNALFLLIAKSKKESKVKCFKLIADASMHILNKCRNGVSLFLFVFVLFEVLKYAEL